MKTYYYNNKVYLIPDFCKVIKDATVIPNSQVQQFNRHLILVWNYKIHRYIVYKRVTQISWKWRQYLGLYVIIMVLEGHKKCYRSFGNWVIRELRIRDKTEGGVHDIKESNILSLSPAEKEQIRKLKHIYEEMNKDFDKIGKTSVWLGNQDNRQHRKIRPKKVYVGIRSGKILKVE